MAAAANPSHSSTVVLFGGNGFVGTEVAHQLVAQGLRVVAVSRTGTMPVHLQNGDSDWPKQVEWLAGDATQPDPALLADAQTVVLLVGSPPLPTFSQSAFEQQRDNNALPNCRAIEAAAEAGVTHIVLLSAYIPAALQRQSFGYYVGKQQSLAAAEQFASTSSQHGATVLKPSGIYGVRYTPSGRAIPINSVMKPIAALQQCLPSSLQSLLPATLVSVQSVAAAVVAAVNNSNDRGHFTVISNQQLVEGDY